MSAPAFSAGSSLSADASGHAECAFTAEQRLKRAELLLDVATTLAAHDSLDDVLATLVELTTNAIKAERGSIFLYDDDADELYSRVTTGAEVREIRLRPTDGLAGHVFSTGTGLIVADAYADPRFDPRTDLQNGFRTRNLVCVPIVLPGGACLGVAQCLNKRQGAFGRHDLNLLQAMAGQAAAALRTGCLLNALRQVRMRDKHYRDLVARIAASRSPEELFGPAMRGVARLLGAEQARLFLHDADRAELWSFGSLGAASPETRVRDDHGIVGQVFRTGEQRSRPPASTSSGPGSAGAGYSLCVPVIGRHGRRLGVIEVLDKLEGRFSDDDAGRLHTIATQVANVLENAHLTAEVENMQNYNRCILQTLTSGVISLDGAGFVVACNAAAARMVGRAPDQLIHQRVDAFFHGDDAWLPLLARKVYATGEPQRVVDTRLQASDGPLSVNVSLQPLASAGRRRLGTMIVLDDMTSEKRAWAAFACYVGPHLADQVLNGGDSIPGGRNSLATILFADIRDFSGLSRRLGPKQTVILLNQYFTHMLACLEANRGVLDKFIGDALMATFGVPAFTGDEDDRAVETAVAMLRRLAAWNDERNAAGLPTLSIGIGINTDLVVSGNIGSPDRMNYTVTGDGVNLASQLQQISKIYRAPLLISDQTARRLRRRFRLRPVDYVLAKGHDQAVLVHEVIDHYPESAFPQPDLVLQHYDVGIEAYRRQRFERALPAFERALDLHPADHLSRLYVERCRAFLNGPPPDRWNGLWPRCAA